MNIQEQLGALESSLDALLRAAASASNSTSASVPPARDQRDESAPQEPAALIDVAGAADAPAPAEPPALDERPTLTVARPNRDAIEMTIGGKSVLLSPEGISELIEELSNVRASMSAEQPQGIPQGWRFAATKNPVMATQKYANGDRLLVLRHGGHGWVPFTFSPNMVVELYAMLTKK
jgi:hypothetical protein